MNFPFFPIFIDGGNDQPNIPEDRFPLVSAERFFKESGMVRSEAWQALGGILMGVFLSVAIIGPMYFNQGFFFAGLMLLLSVVLGGGIFRKGIRQVDSISSAYAEYLRQQDVDQVREMLEIAEGNGWRASTYNFARRRLAEVD